MKTKTALIRWLAVAAGLRAALSLVHGAPQATFTDTWKDTVVGGSLDTADTSGSFSIRISEALTNTDIDAFDAGTQVSLNLGPVGSTVAIFSDALGDDPNYSPGKTHATFPLVGTDASGNGTTNGSVTLSWTTTTITLTGSASADVLGEEQAFAGGSLGTATNSAISDTNEVTLTVDSTDNTNGGLFTYDNPNVPVTGTNAETEHTNTDGGTFPLEKGSISGTAGGISFSDTWKDIAMPNSYSTSTSGSLSVNISLPFDPAPIPIETGGGGVIITEWYPVPVDPLGGGVISSELSHRRLSLPFEEGDIVSSNFDAGTQVSLNIGPALIFSDALGDDPKYTPGRKSATFPIIGMDAAGDETNIGSVTVSWTATSITLTGSATADVLGEEQIFAAASGGEPTNSAISDLYYLSLTLDASDNDGGTLYYENPNVPVSGKNTETLHTNWNGSYFALEKGSIMGAADFIPPKVSISSPEAAVTKVSDATTVIHLKGKASDNISVASVECVVNGDTNNVIDIDQEDELPTNTLSWTASMDLGTNSAAQAGSNVVTVIAFDTSGNYSYVARTFLWIETNFAVVTVIPTTAGKVTGITNGQVLRVGKGYPVTATATNKNWIFSEWTDAGGDVLSSRATFDYIDPSKTNGTLRAKFVANPFYNSNLAGASELAGTYTGLYYDTNDGFPVKDAGYITISVRASGAFSGKLYDADYASLTFTLSGQLSEAPDGSFATAALPFIKVNGKEYLKVNLQVATDPTLTDPGAGLLGGSVDSLTNTTETNGSYSGEIQGELSLYNTNILAGLYNVVIAPAASDPAQGPGGYSYGTATVSKKGAVTLVLKLADGTSPAISFSTSLAQDGTCPLYASLYGTDGMILGWMQFATNGSGAIFNGSSSLLQSNVNWAKKAWAGGKYYPNGFMATPSLSGNLYLRPKAGTNLFGATALSFVIDAGYSGLSLPDETDIPVRFHPAGNTFSDTNRVTITLTATNGALAGSFYQAGRKSSFSGVEVGGGGYGFYAGTNKETGPIWIGR